MSLLVACLYILVSAFLFGSSIYILSRDLFARLNQAYALFALCLLGWVGTLFVFNSTGVGPGLIWIGRANFAAAALLAPSALWFVQAVLQRHDYRGRVILAESLIVAALSLFTASVDLAETVQSGIHITTYGLLWPLLILHLVMYLGAAVYQALVPPADASPKIRSQARYVGIGILVSSVVGIASNRPLSKPSSQF